MLRSVNCSAPDGQFGSGELAGTCCPAPVPAPPSPPAPSVSPFFPVPPAPESVPASAPVPEPVPELVPEPDPVPVPESPSPASPPDVSSESSDSSRPPGCWLIAGPVPEGPGVIEGGVGDEPLAASFVFFPPPSPEVTAHRASSARTATRHSATALRRQ